jgi:hypothetical protein
VDKVITSDGGGVAVAHDHNDLEPGVGQLDTGGEGQGPAMRGVERIEIHVHAHTPGAADPRHQDNVVFAKPGAVDGPDQRPQDNAVAAPRTPDMGELLLVAQIFVDQFGNFGHFSSQQSGSAFRCRAINPHLVVTLSYRLEF